jgi:hypothetical protein
LRAIEPFMPVRVSPNAELTNEGIRITRDRSRPSQLVQARTVEDVRNILPVMQTQIVAAVASLLPNPTADGREAWSVVNACLFQFSHTERGESEIEEAVVLLLVCRTLMRDVPQDDDQRALAVFVDRYLPVARGERVSGLLPRRAPTINDVYRDLNGGDNDADYIKRITLPWAGSLGANLQPFNSVGDALDFFDSSDLIVERDRVAILVNRHGSPMVTEVQLSEDGLRDVRDLVAGARKSLSQPSSDDTTVAGNAEGPLGSYVCAEALGHRRFRVNLDRLADGSAYWTFRRFHLPEAFPHLNFGFDPS